VTGGALRAGEVIATSAGELTRLWRAMRAHASPDVWPGLLDGIAGNLFLRLGEGLAEEADPALVWQGLVGMVRVDPLDPDRSRLEIDAEWDAVEVVLAKACHALACGEQVREWLARALAVGRAGAHGLLGGGGPPGILVVRWIAGLAFARPPAPIEGRP
jgi:hypothetical protein